MSKTVNRILTVTNKGGNCGIVQIMHKASGKNVKFKNSARIWLTLQILHRTLSIANSACVESQSYTT